jgi:hypothetical protein
MLRTIEAVIEEGGTMRLLESVDLHSARRALVTILDEEPAELPNETALMSEAALPQERS